jgi:hypothetical protein
MGLTLKPGSISEETRNKDRVKPAECTPACTGEDMTGAK